MATVVGHLLRRLGGKPKAAVATYGATAPNGVHQIDLLFLPTDPATHARYALTVIDLATRAVAAHPLKIQVRRGGALGAAEHIHRRPGTGGPPTDGVGRWH